MAHCPQCKKEREPCLLRIFKIDPIIIEGIEIVPTKYEMKCIVCHWNFEDTEMAEEMAKSMVETEKVFFESADKIWREILG